MPDEQLLRTLKMIKRSFIFISVAVVVMIIAGIFGSMKKGVDFFTFLPLFFIPLLYTRWIVYNKIKKEAESRKL